MTPAEGRVFAVRLPQVIRAGVGALDAVGESVASLGGRRSLVVTDRTLGKSPWLSAIVDRCRECGISVTVYDGIASEPTTREVDDALAAFRDGGCDSVIGFGGGSSLDTAKSVKVLATNGGSMVDYEGRERFAKAGVPLVAIPTTAGTGSEVTRYVAVTDPQRNVKMLVTSSHLVPEVAILDPRPMTTMPPAVTASTGIDALTHAIEAYVSKASNPFSDALALSAIGVIARNLEVAFGRPDDIVAREAMAIAALEAGIAFSAASVALVHAMARPLGANFGIPHGAANAMLLEVVMEFSLPAAMPRYAAIGRAAGAASESSSDEHSARAAVERIGELCRRLQVPSLAAWGVDESRLLELAPKMAADAMDSGSPANNPRQATAQQIRSLYARAYRRW